MEAAGASSQTVDFGAKLFVQVRMGPMTILRKEYTFDEAIDAVNLSCPLKEYRKITEVEIPSGIPSGGYSVVVEAYTQGHEREITFLEGSIVF
jgi:hypothetical protein